MAFRIHLLFVYTALCLLSLHYTNAFSPLEWPKAKSPITAFSWQNCGPSSDPLQVTALTVAPDPIQIPGNVTVGIAANVTSALPTDVQISVLMEKKIAGFYIKVPCVDKLGSCTYDNVCTMWAEDCPKYFEKYGLPCNCPIPAKSYSVPDAVVAITAKLPPGVAGDYRMTADVSSGSGHLACIKFQFTFTG